MPINTKHSFGNKIVKNHSSNYSQKHSITAHKFSILVMIYSREKCNYSEIIKAVLTLVETWSGIIQPIV